MANIFEILSQDGNITPEKARKSRQMQFHDKTAYVWGLRYRWDPSLSMNPVRQFAHFMPPWHQEAMWEGWPGQTGPAQETKSQPLLCRRAETGELCSSTGEGCLEHCMSVQTAAARTFVSKKRWSTSANWLLGLCKKHKKVSSPTLFLNFSEL